MTSSDSVSRTCHYCGLPVPVPLWRSEEAEQGPSYCCLGCRIAEAVVQEQGESGVHRAMLTRLGIAVFFTMNVMVFTFALWAYDLKSLPGDSPLASSFASLLRSINLLVSLPVLFLLGGPIAENAWRQWRVGTPSTDGLILTSVAAAYIYSAGSVWSNTGNIYVETGCVTLVFVTLGRWLEATGKRRSVAALDQLAALLPAEVTLLTEGGSCRIPLEAVQPGQLLRVDAGERIPADGTLRSRAATLDEQLVTGESWPVDRQAGEPVVGGTLNLTGDITVEVVRSPGEGTLSRLMDAVREARLKKGSYQRLADRISTWFLPVVSLIAIAALCGHGWREGFGYGMQTALSVLLIACPCALGIATPMAIWVALGAAARRGIVVRNAEVLEKLEQVRAIRFDKTGTLTTGSPRLARLVTATGSCRDEVFSWARVLAERSHHAFSRALLQQKPREHPATASLAGPDSLAAFPERVQQVSVVPGRGLYACVEGGDLCPVALGNRALMDDLNLELPDDLEGELAKAIDRGDSCSLIGWGGLTRGLFLFDEQLRSDAQEALADCSALDLDVAVLTGDHPGRGARLARELGVCVQAGLTPDQKVKEIELARRNIGPTAMVGDGLNDVAACSAADVGMALGCGADVTRDSAEVCLVSDQLKQAPWVIDLSRRTMGTVRSNLLWAFLYNGVGVTVAAAGWLHPAVAAVLMVGSSLYVIMNSLRLDPASTNGPSASWSECREPGPEAEANRSVTPSTESSEPEHEASEQAKPEPQYVEKNRRISAKTNEWVAT